MADIRPGAVERTCGVCHERTASYTCPRCHAAYCSVPCYKKHGEAQCSEAFFREQVVGHLQSAGNTFTYETAGPHQRRAVEAMLRRTRGPQEDACVAPSGAQDDDAPGSGSGDESAATEHDSEMLLSALALLDAGVSADRVLASLPAHMRRRFQRQVASGNVGELVAEWLPWWAPAESEGASPAPVPPCAVQPVPLASLTSVSASPLLQHMRLELVLGYAVLARLYNGEPEADALEAAGLLGAKLCGLSLGARATEQRARLAELDGADARCAALLDDMAAALRRLGWAGADVARTMGDARAIYVLGPAALASALGALVDLLERACSEARAAGVPKSAARALVGSRHTVFFVLCWHADAAAQAGLAACEHAAISASLTRVLGRA